ncbi:MerR family transcriptional regulator [Paenibacillus sp. SGZ-1009]|uniref:MerR family transcriptional regulator n=1 Tax=Paenibacillus campi TaxID=3106031 RepID=UPI002B002A17|nr:MerR family transcriptional regulator [Paenibacillus sp. SGZ-1009]
MKLMTRGEIAKKTGVSAATLRYYEQHHFLPAPQRNANGYRVYTPDYLVKIKFIKDTKSLGYSLKQIKKMLEMINTNIEPATLKTIVHDQIDEIEQKINHLRTIQNFLANLLTTSDQDIQAYVESFHVQQETDDDE